eukprot:EG_transcript_39696
MSPPPHCFDRRALRPLWADPSVFAPLHLGLFKSLPANNHPSFALSYIFGTPSSLHQLFLYLKQRCFCSPLCSIPDLVHPLFPCLLASLVPGPSCDSWPAPPRQAPERLEATVQFPVSSFLTSTSDR